MNNNYYNYNFNPNQAFMRNIHIPPANIPQNFNMMQRSLPRISSLFSQASVPKAATALKASASASQIPKLTFASLLNGTSKTLGVINQAIPVFYQVKPIWNNAKTMFRVVKELNTKENPNKNINQTKTNETTTNNKKNNEPLEKIEPKEKKEDNNSPTFFI